MNASEPRLKTFWIFVYENSTSWHFQDFVSQQLAKHLGANAFERPDLLFDSNHGYIFVVLRLFFLPMRITRQLGSLKDLGSFTAGWELEVGPIYVVFGVSDSKTTRPEVTLQWEQDSARFDARRNLRASRVALRIFSET